MDTNGRVVNLALLFVVALFLTLGLGGMAVYTAFSHDQQAAKAPAASSTGTPFAAAPPLTAAPAARCTNDAALAEEATDPKVSEFQPRQEFVKTWRIKNTGTCAWTGSYKFVFVDGARMGAPAEITLPDTPVGTTAELKVKMNAAANPGVSAGSWKLKGPGGEYFGAPFNTTIRVRGQGARGCSGPPVIASFRADPTTITAGQSTTLSWGLVENADAAEIDNGIGGVATPDSRAVSPKTTTTYTLSARCGANVTQAQVTVTVE